MEIVAILRTLWSRKIIWLPGLLAAFAAAAYMQSKPVQTGGFAGLRLQLDTNPSQLVKTTPAGSESLGWRAQTLAEMSTGEETRERVAKALGVKPQDVRVLEPKLGTPVTQTAIARAATKADSPAPAFLVASVTANARLGSLDVGAYAPDRESARRFALAMVEAIGAIAQTSGELAAKPAPTPTPAPPKNAVPTPTPSPVQYGLGAPRDTSVVQPYKVIPGAVKARTDKLGGGPAGAIAAGFAVFVWWSAVVLIVPAVVTRLRASRHAAATRLG